MATVELAEWEQATPQTVSALAGLSLDITLRERDLLTHLERHRMIAVRELRGGLGVTTTSFVGSVKVGPLTVRVRPKVDGRPFSVLLGYALGLHDLELLPEHNVSLTNQAFQDLLVSRLTSEAVRLLARGICRNYMPLEGGLASPRGRIDFGRLARAPLTSADLPCRYHERNDNVLPNRVLLAGLQLAYRLAIDPNVRMRTFAPAAALAERVRPVPLNAPTFRALDRSLSRLTTAYVPAFALIRLLMAGAGIGADAGAQAAEIPGFLFDMNRLFQDAVGRFLTDWLSDSDVSQQYRLTDLFRYHPQFNPRQKRAPTPRPDFVLLRKGRVVAIADAKYRDLWNHDLPPEMLYQLSIYALSQADCQTATILYATTATGAREAAISISDPIRGLSRAQVRLRPVILSHLAETVASTRTARNDRRRREYARYLAYGVTTFSSVS